MGLTDTYLRLRHRRGGTPRAALVEVAVRPRGQEDFAAIFDGWCWARTVGRTAARLTAPPAVASAANVAARRHCAATVGTPYPGKGLLKRLDAAVGRLLTHLAALPNDGEEETGQGWGMV